MLKEVVATFLDRMKQPAPAGLEIEAILGRPETGREEYEFPLCAAIFAKEGEASIPKPHRRIGDTPALGRTIQIELYLYATDEVELMDLIDLLATIKRTYVGFTVEGKNFSITYDETVRAEPDPNDPTTRFVTVTSIFFTTI